MRLGSRRIADVFPRPCRKCGRICEATDFVSQERGGHRYYHKNCKACYAEQHRESYARTVFTSEYRRKRNEQNKKYRADAIAKGICIGCLTRPESETSQFCPLCKDSRNKQRIEKVAGFKKQIFDHYGRRCSCKGCDVVLEEFLTIDHVGGWGKDHRGATGCRISGEVLYREIIRLGFPATFRILCFNCNCSQAFRGYCPHELKGEIAA